MGDFDRGGYGRDSGPRKMHKAVCSECNKECEVPFKPTEGKPIFCKDCFRKKRSF
ncbi:DNA-directed RNA polymerase [Candidatus Woesearchaeota archaeon CG11_big_fil_rev_8_21_14_0_20_43_8]|nr:MAG: DNA-directed RNA polymerase [Candidatus Woesearchaeota archaeon CG11_big_fil_rev_8_21_14_0_20_43_8]